ncbi:MAG: CpsD/CapB family tyrosine-protein kinase [Terriglobales bacterium]
MSKNFELMQNVGLGLEDIATPDAPPANPLPPNRNDGRAKLVPLQFDPLAQQECLQLVQRLFLLQAEPPHCVVFAGIEHGNGCSWVCAQAAELLAENTPGSVCLVDANLRSPSLARMFGANNDRGLTNALRENGAIADFAQPLRRANLFLVPGGTPTPDFHSLLKSEGLKNRLAELASAFDYVVIDAPPLREYGDAVTLGWLTHGLVLVLEANVTRRDFTRQIAEALKGIQVKILGAVLNKRTFPIPRAVYRRL